jgi:hypothetical protein
VLVEYLHQGAEACPLIRIYRGIAEEVRAMQSALWPLATHSAGGVAITQIPGFTGVDGCCLIARVGDIDRGVVPVPGGCQSALFLPTRFECVLRPSSWSDVLEKLDWFANDSGGYQWLTDTGPVQLLFSWDGLW